MEETKEKVKLTEEIFDNILVMMKSSTEDFFVALDAWKNLERSLLADIVLYKLVTQAQGDIAGAIPRLQAWVDDWDNRLHRTNIHMHDAHIVMLYKAIDHNKISELDKKLFKRLCENYTSHMFKLLELDDIIDASINIKWKTK